MVTAAIAGLPPRFDDVVNIYQHSKEKLTFDAVLADLIQDEHLQELRAKRTHEVVAFSALGHSRDDRKTQKPTKQLNVTTSGGSGEGF